MRAFLFVQFASLVLTLLLSPSEAIARPLKMVAIQKSSFLKQFVSNNKSLKAKKSTVGGIFGSLDLNELFHKIPFVLIEKIGVTKNEFESLDFNELFHKIPSVLIENIGEAKDEFFSCYEYVKNGEGVAQKLNNLVEVAAAHPKSTVVLAGCIVSFCRGPPAKKEAEMMLSETIKAEADRWGRRKID